MSQVRERPDRALRPRGAAFAVFVSLLRVLTVLTVSLALPTIAAPPAAAQDGGEQNQQDSSENGSDDEDLEDDGTGLKCREEDHPGEEEDLPAGWWADSMHLEELHQRVPEQGEGVTVAVLDTGLWKTPQFVNADVATPIDLTTGSPQEVTNQHGFSWDCDGHGTSVAGLIIAQPAENVPSETVPDGFDSDMMGVAPNASLLPIRITVGQDDGEGADLATGIYQAIENDARIINISIEMGNPYGPLEEAVAYAEQQGVLIVAAAGNNESAAYPAAYAAKYDNVISVGSVKQDGTASDFSAPSATTIAAPGEKIVTTNRDLGHLEESGTSFSAPLVSGLAALMMNHFDGIPPEQIRSRLAATADPVAGEGGNSKITGAGMVNPVSALTAIVDMEQANQKLEVEPYPGRYDPPPPDQMPRNVALAAAGGAILVAVVALATLATVRRARTRGWRPGA